MKKYRKPHRYKKRKPIYRSRFFWLTALVLLLISSFFYFLFLSDFFQVKKINISGTEQVFEEEVRSLIEFRLENKILFFTTKSIFHVNLNKIKEDILKEFPAIVRIEIRRSFPDALNVSVIERQALATFCQQDNCLLLDKEGVVFEADGNFEPVIKTLILGDKINLGEGVIGKDELAQLLEINSYLERDLGTAVKELLISSPEKLTVLTEEGWKLYFNPQEDIKWQLTKLKVLLDEKIPPEKRKDLEWIELRFGNFANPKYKD